MKTTELENSQMNVEMSSNSNSSNTLTFETLEGTPFTIVKEGDLYFGVISTHRLTEGFDNKEDLVNNLKTISWDRIVQVIWVVVAKFTKIDLKEIEKHLEN